MSTAEITTELDHLRGIHPKEIGCRVGRYVALLEELQALTTCRDHWKTAFEHERENVIRLRREVFEAHKWRAHSPCQCRDCQLVRNPPGEPTFSREWQQQSAEGEFAFIERQMG